MQKGKFSLDEINSINKNTMMEWMQIEYIDAGEGFLTARMPINERTYQPQKILHGGANLALSETVAGFGSSLLVDMNKYTVRGAQVSANHIGSASKGFAIAEGTLIHKGKHTHVWNIDIKHENGKPLSTCRITNFIIKR